MILGSTIYAHMGSEFRANGSDDSVASIVERLGGGLRVSGHVPAYASNRQDAVAIKTGSGPNAVAPIWNEVQIFQDEYTRAQEGEIRLYGLMLGNFAVLRADGFKRYRFRNS